MSDMIDKLAGEFSRKKNVTQREIMEVALVEYLQKYGFKGGSGARHLTCQLIAEQGGSGARHLTCQLMAGSGEEKTGCQAPHLSTY
jgi:hypothetical protein